MRVIVDGGHASGRACARPLALPTLRSQPEFRGPRLLKAGKVLAASLCSPGDRGSITHLTEVGNHRVGSGRSRDCPDLQRHPSRTRPGHRPPVRKSEIARLMWSCRRTGKAVRCKPGGLFLYSIIPGCAASRAKTRPGMNSDLRALA